MEKISDEPMEDNDPAVPLSSTESYTPFQLMFLVLWTANLLLFQATVGIF